MKSLRFSPHWRPSDPYQVIGFLSLVNDILAADPSASRWLEIGSYAGESATLLLGFPQILRLDCVDHWKEAADTVKARFGREIAAGRVSVHQSSSTEFEATAGIYDAIYIDGDHSYEAVAADIAAYASHIKPGGHLAGHDYHAGFPGVVRAVDECRKQRPLRTYADGSWCIRMPI